MTDLKYCKNCKHCRPDRLLQIVSFGLFTPFDTAKCARPKIDLIFGEVQLEYCRAERMSYYTIDTCGENAKYWEARK